MAGMTGGAVAAGATTTALTGGAALPFAIGGILIAAAADGIGALMAGGAQSEKDRRDAKLVDDQIKNVQKLKERGEIDTAEAVSRIEKAKANASSAVREAMDKSVQAATSQMERAFTESIEQQTRSYDKYSGQLDKAGDDHRTMIQDQLSQYRDNMKEQFKNITNSFVTRRLGGSGALIAAGAKQAETQSKQEKGVLSDAAKFQEGLNNQLDQAFTDFTANTMTLQKNHQGNIAELNLKAGASLGNQLSGIEQGFTQMAESRKLSGQQFGYGLDTQGFQLEGAKGALENSANAWANGGASNAFFGSMLGGAGAAAGAAGSSLLPGAMVGAANEMKGTPPNTTLPAVPSSSPTAPAGYQEAITSTKRFPTSPLAPLEEQPSQQYLLGHR